jgi:fatty-acyl-CoA synthase
MSARTFNLADVFETVVDTCPDRLALVAGEARRSYADLDRRANRVAHHLRGAGITPGAHVAIWSRNRAEWVEAMLGCFKIRAVPINVNYRYVADEITYLLQNSEAQALLVERRYLPVLATARRELPLLRHVIVLDDDTPEAPEPDHPTYESVLATASPERGFAPRTADDRYVLYTGGTTGLPKGVIWRGEDLYFAALHPAEPGQDPPCDPATAVTQAIHREPDRRAGLGPLMHGNGQWAALSPLTAAGTAILWTQSWFDPKRILQLLSDERATTVVAVGDAMARPLLDALTERPGAYDLSHLTLFGSGGAILSPSVKRELSETLPRCMIVDGFGASETGSNGRMIGYGGGGRPRFAVRPGVAVLDDTLTPVRPGETGRLAVSGHIPLGYHRDEAKTAATFPVDAHGVRWAVPGDNAILEADGTVTLLGRGSVSINTGGEKVYPEEVEAVLKGHPTVYDVIVVGLPDELLGSRVTAVVQPRPGQAPELSELQDHCRSTIAGYKVPRELRLVEEIQRTPAGKPDYPWAHRYALEQRTAQTVTR